MEIHNISVNKLKPDPNQPRKRFDPEKLESLKKNIQIEGVINPIEIDSNFQIITGETRWKAAKLAGLKTIPCKIFDVSNPKLRFRRQFLENIHNDSMDFEETAKAMVKFIKLFHNKKNTHNDNGIRWLANEIGISRSFIEDRLNYINLNSVEKKVIKHHGIGYIRGTVTMNPEIRKKLFKKLSSGEFKSQYVYAIVSSALKRYPEEASKILSIDYTDMNEYDTRKYLAKKIENYVSMAEVVKSKIGLVEELADKLMKLTNLLKIHSMGEIPDYQKFRINSLIHLLDKNLIEFKENHVLQLQPK